MKRLLPIALLAAIATACLALAADDRYHEYRLKLTEPPYGLAKIKKMIGRLKRDEANDLPAITRLLGRDDAS